jgi:hypothetical protein
VRGGERRRRFPAAAMEEEAGIEAAAEETGVEKRRWQWRRPA